MTVADFPALNAFLNALSLVLLVAGYVCIRLGNWRAHVACMISALLSSAAFLACYLVFHATYGSVRFTEPGNVRYVYFALLIPHVILAIVVLPFIVLTVVQPLRRRWDQHRRIARWTLPIWLYVSITGVLVYFMNYVWYPSTEIETKLGKSPVAMERSR